MMSMKITKNSDFRLTIRYHHVLDYYLSDKYI